MISRKRIFSILKITISLGLALLLFWYLYKDNFSDTIQGLKQVNYSWVMVSIVLGIASHLVRAYRWKLLMEPTGKYPTVMKSFGALLIGYLVNLAIPRLGEVSRCLVLKRTDQIPVTTSLGTVVSERVLDVISLLLITGFTVLIEFEKLNSFFYSVFADKLSGLFSGIRGNWLFILLGVVMLIIVWVLVQKKIRNSGWWIKVKTLARETWLGFISITKLKNPASFWIATLGIWVLYYFMSYVIFFSMDATMHLGWKAGMALLVMGGLAMSAPVQGGIGAYHLLVSGLLIYYGVSKQDGLSFAFLLHSSQILLVILAGALAAALLFLGKKGVNSQAAQMDEV